METTAFFRRQAALCLRLSDFCSDEQIANHLRSKAADYHQRALRAEFDLWHDTHTGDAWSRGAIVSH
jgi:hypothetical protein